MTNPQGTEFGSDYIVFDRIGSGASGIVYRATQKSTGVPVAVKFLRDEYGEDPEIIQRFVTERSSLIGLADPHIIETRDLVLDAGRMGIVMEYAAGPTLRQVIHTEGTLRPADALVIAHEILGALSAAHRHGVVHRDIKPDNIILRTPESATDPGVKVADFGIAKILGNRSRTTHMVGTPEYMAPELIQSASAEPGVDVYALGICLYEMLAGRTPFAHEDANPFSIAHHHVSSVVPPIDGLDAGLAAVLATLLEKDPARRPSADKAIGLVDAAAPTVADAPALPRVTQTPSFHQATVLRAPRQAEEAPAVAPAPESPAAVAACAEQLPTLPAPSTATVLKPQARSRIAVEAGAETPAKPRPRLVDLASRVRDFVTASRPRVVACLVCVALACCGLGGWGWHSARAHRGIASTSVTIEDETLPSGLVISRRLSWDRDAQTLTYRLTYKTTKATISGQIFEAIPSPTGGCASVRWKGAPAKKHSPALTSIKARCGWSIQLPPITRSSPVTARATITTAGWVPSARTDLSAWLHKQHLSTLHDLDDTHTTSTAYPLQRLRGMTLSMPGSIDQGALIPVSIIGKWPSGDNTLTPVYTSPATGPATSILSDITGGHLNQFRFDDRCSGAVAVTPDGHDLSALHPATCSVGAVIGNYDVKQVPLTIVGLGS
ncbi:MAG: serine/threonine-protein kinase [Actinomycetaceae bacterium]|nr:serine/threonine-protein kinase [Actinomycetaceae bacterium]MDU0969860.1 serine/threonine-protein kinase [Actinomycetaceae bacterium]